MELEGFSTVFTKDPSLIRNLSQLNPYITASYFSKTHLIYSVCK
jgi:hypothetical protein